MPFCSHPTQSGTYHIKAFGRERDAYWKYIPDNNRWVQLSTLEAPLKPSRIQFQWIITPIPGSSSSYTISPAYDSGAYMTCSASPARKRWSWLRPSRKYQQYGFVQGHHGPCSTMQIIPDGSGAFAQITADHGKHVLDCRDTDTQRVHFFPNDAGKAPLGQRWVFEPVEESPTPLPPPCTDPPNGKSFENLWFTLTPEQAAKEAYDIIIVGTGMGAGVLAGDMFDTNARLGKSAKSILVIEKGGLPFHSHCLNTARPSGLGKHRGQQNDTFYEIFRDAYKFSNPDQAAAWKGGPMFNLGGRGAAWGLFIPRVHEETLQKEFGPELSDALTNTWYEEAENLMGLSQPTTKSIHQTLLDRLSAKSGHECHWQWGRIASEFIDPKNYDFATGAYSPIDKLLAIAMSKPRRPNGTYTDHPNWKLLLRTEVRSIVWDDTGKQALGVVVRDSNGAETTIKLRTTSHGQVTPDACIVLGAGSVGSPSILMRSGMTDYLKEHGGLRLTDHLVCGRGFNFRYLDPSVRAKVGAMKLQSHVRLKSGTIVLSNISIDTSSFLQRDFLPKQCFTNQDFPELVVAHIFPARLNPKNKIELDTKAEPVITAGREADFNVSDPEVVELWELTKNIVQAIRDTLKIETFSPDPEDSTLFELNIGSSGHELGTIPMQGSQGESFRSCLENNLKFRGRQGVYVCDLSTFPYSPESNPTLTLVSLALRLSRTILPHTGIQPGGFLPEDTISVVNHTGETIKVFVTNRAGISLKATEANEGKEDTVLEPGERLDRRRKRGVKEAVLVHKLCFGSITEYQNESIAYVATPGKICVVE